MAVPFGMTLAAPGMNRTGESGRRTFVIRVANTNHRTRREDFNILVQAVVSLGHELGVNVTRLSEAKGQEKGPEYAGVHRT